MGTVETIAGGSSKQKADVVEDGLTSNRRKRKEEEELEQQGFADFFGDGF